MPSLMTNANPSAAEDKASLALIPAEGYPESHVILPLSVHPLSKREIQGLRAFNFISSQGKTLVRPLQSATKGGEWVPDEQLAAGWGTS
jgi:hypothetical protein